MSNISELSELLKTEGGRITPVPYEFLADFPQEMISQFCVENGVYQIPTVELIHFLKAEIGGLEAMEIGAGNGCIGRALGIKMVDSHLQEQPKMREHYEQTLKQPIVNYGKDVLQNDAIRAVKLYRPKVVVGCWITNKMPGGFSIADTAGIEEALLFKNGVIKYIHVGNDNTHWNKSLLDTMRHKKLYFPWLLSRSMSKEANSIYIFEK